MKNKLHLWIVAFTLISSVFIENATALSFTGTVSGITVNYEIDLPDGYNQSTNYYPVIYFLHGKNQTPLSSKTTGKIKQQLDLAVAAGLIEPTILVYADGDMDSFYADSYDWSRPIETAIVEDLVPYIEANYRVRTGYENRALLGFSMGGNGAAKTLAKFPDTFGCAVSLDGAFLSWPQMLASEPDTTLDMFNNMEAYYTPYSVWYNTELNSALLDSRLRLVVGLLDGYNDNFHTYLDSLGVVHEYELTSCGHTPMCILQNEQRSSFEFIGQHFSNTNTNPTFISDPFTKPDAIVGVFYNQSIAGKASDADGDTLTFSKVSGPDWLSIYPNGQIKGTPLYRDMGENSWSVMVEDGNGGQDTATLIITVQRRRR